MTESNASEEPRVLAIVPAYNEAANIRTVIDELTEKAPFVEILVVNDGSDDATGEAAQSMGVQVVNLPVNLGIGGAVQAGFKYAAEKGYDIAVQIDGDGQHDPSYIRKLLDPISSGEADVVVGSRYIQGAHDAGYKTPWHRRMGMVLFSWLTSAITKKRITDTTSGFRALNERAVQFFSKHYPTDFPDAEALLLLHLAGFRITEVPVTMNQRASGKSSITPIKSLYYPLKELLSIVVVLLRGREQKRGGS